MDRRLASFKSFSCQPPTPENPQSGKNSKAVKPFATANSNGSIADTANEVWLPMRSENFGLVLDLLVEVIASPVNSSPLAVVIEPRRICRQQTRPRCPALGRPLFQRPWPARRFCRRIPRGKFRPRQFVTSVVERLFPRRLQQH